MSKENIRMNINENLKDLCKKLYIKDLLVLVCICHVDL